jgi:hypothetical protein
MKKIRRKHAGSVRTAHAVIAMSNRSVYEIRGAATTKSVNSTNYASVLALLLRDDYTR